MSLKNKNISYILMTNIVKEIVCIMAVSFEGFRTIFFPLSNSFKERSLCLPDLELTSEMLESLFYMLSYTNNTQIIQTHTYIRQILT